MDVSSKIDPMVRGDLALEKQLLADLIDSETHQGFVQRTQPPFGAAWPEAAYAIVEPVEPCVTQSAPRFRTEWTVKFAPQSAPLADPLTGWTGGSDPLQQVELRFPSREAAEEYLSRQGLSYRVHEPPTRRWRPARSPRKRADVAWAFKDTCAMLARSCGRYQDGWQN